MVTAEMAAAIPVLVLLLVFSLGALGQAVDALRCGDAVRVAARHLARGESADTAIQGASELAPRGAVFGVSSAGPLVTVSVHTPGRASLAGVSLPGCQATAHTEVESSASSESTP